MPGADRDGLTAGPADRLQAVGGAIVALDSGLGHMSEQAPSSHVTGARCSAPPGRSTQTTRDVLRKRHAWIKPRAWALHFIPSRFIPSLPHVRLVANGCLAAVANDGLTKNLLVIEHLFELLVGSKILYERNRVGIFRLWIDRSVDPPTARATLSSSPLLIPFSFKSMNWNFTRRSLK